MQKIGNFPVNGVPLEIKKSDFSYLESNLGKHIGVQFSECLNDSEEFTRLKMRCRSAGWIKYFFIRTNAIKRFSAINMAKTKFFTLLQLCPITEDILSLVVGAILRTRTAESIKEGSVCMLIVKLSSKRSDPANIFRKSKFFFSSNILVKWLNVTTEST